MKGRLDWNLDDYDEKDSFMRASTADLTYYVIHEILSLSRKYVKYGLPEQWKTAEDVAEGMYGDILNIVHENVNMDYYR